MSYPTIFGSNSFSPLSLPDKGFWFDATRTDGYTLATGRASQLNDLYGNGNNATQGTVGRQPLFVASGINGRGTFHFRDDSATARQMAIADSATVSSVTFTIFTVVRRIGDLTANEHIIGKWDITGNLREWRQLVQSDDNAHALITNVAGAGGAASVNLAGGAMPIGANYIVETSYDGTNVMTAINGGTYTQTPVANVYQGTGGIQIGSTETFGDPFEGYFSEALYHNAHMATSNKRLVLRYLSKKYGITVP